MTERWACARCGSPWAPGAPCCPSCRSLEHVADTEEDGVPKIDRNGRVSYEADAVPPAVLEEKLEAAEAEIAELKAEQAAPAALEVTVAAPHAEPPRPHVPPRLPPRRPPVPKGGGDA